MAKPHVTRTLGPIHFEDLDPHRFEDLIRQLAYDFRAWKSIESTGRGGADDGFDVRAYEEGRSPPLPAAEDEEPEDSPHPMEGNLWMIQCKREKEIGPKKVAAIVAAGVTEGGGPYGYVLAAPVHFSKAAHDKFRETLRQRNVQEFYLWGAGELEDMLYQPKNDHILFAFFGISLTARRRSRTSHVRATIIAKNKLIRVLGDSPQHQSILIRDLNDQNYPYESECADFAKLPPWQQYSAIEFHPLGLVLSMNRHFAFWDSIKKQWDYTKLGNQVRTHASSRQRRDDDLEGQILRIKGFWEQIPRANRATFVRNGLLRYDEIAYIDEKGDTEYQCTHVFVDLKGRLSPFSASSEYLEINEHHQESLDGFARTSVFPETFPEPIFGTIYSDAVVTFPQGMQVALRHGSGDISLYDLSGKYDNLIPTDVIPIASPDRREGAKTHLKITNTRVMLGKDLGEMYADNPSLKHSVEQQIGSELKATDKIRVIEATAIYDWQIEQNRPVV